jgi:hypothetical protein
VSANSPDFGAGVFDAQFHCLRMSHRVIRVKRIWTLDCLLFEIHDGTAATLGPDAVSYSSVTRHLREARFLLSKPEPHPADVQIDLDDLALAILAALEDGPFVSVRHLSRVTYLPSTTVYRRLTQSLGFVARHL